MPTSEYRKSMMPNGKESETNAFEEIADEIAEEIKKTQGDFPSISERVLKRRGKMPEDLTYYRYKILECLVRKGVKAGENDDLSLERRFFLMKGSYAAEKKHPKD